MSPSTMFILGCLCGGSGFVGVAALLFMQDWQVRRGTDKLRKEMER